MVTPKQLVGAVAKATGVHEGTVVLHDRNLLVAGLRTEGQRGRGKSAASHRDAANLLTAVVGASNVKDSAYPIQHHGRMMSCEGRWELGFFPVPELTSLGDDHTFSDALEALLRSASSGSMLELYNSTIKAQIAEIIDLTEEINPPVRFEITIHEPFIGSSIEIFTMDFENEAGGLRGISEKRNYHRARRLNEKNLDFDPPLDMADHGDLSHRHTFTHKTIAAIGDLLKD